MGRAQLRAIYIGGAAAVGLAAAAALSFGAALDRICTNIGCMYETRDIDGALGAAAQPHHREHCHSVDYAELQITPNRRNLPG